MKTSFLLASVGAGVGALGGGGALAYHLLQKETVKVRDTLKKKGHEFLSFEEGEDLETWKEIGNAYANSEKNRLTGLNIAKPESSNKATETEAKALQKVCKDLVNNSNYKEVDLLAAEQWCVKPITIQELIKKHRKILVLEANQDLEQTEWNKKVNDYLEASTENKLPQTTLTQKGTEVEDRKKLKADCSKLTNKKNHDVDFHKNYQLFNDWCTVPKTNGVS